jgi:membrane-associated protein
MDAESLINYGGLLFVCLIVFSTTGLFFTFFLPSGAVLFSTGVLVAAGDMEQNIFSIVAIVTIACISGSWTGYFIGLRAGPELYKRKDSFYYKRKHLEAAKEFYNKYGTRALIAGYFLPIIRSFFTVLAGIIALNKTIFAVGTAAGSFLWVFSFIGIGYIIGSRPELKPVLTYIVVGFICIVTVPLLIKIIRSFNKK